MAKGLSKAEFISKLAEGTNISKKEAAAYLEAVGKIVGEELKAHGEVTIPGLIKVRVAIRKATPERERMNPFTKQMQMVPAKPERRVVKAAPVKALKEIL
ncbi:MAG: HU family DNA-binding protein [Anaerolineales bacterium]|jgi:nucleoid DNA-binding protein